MKQLLATVLATLALEAGIVAVGMANSQAHAATHSVNVQPDAGRHPKYLP